ncbi:unnamed protein product [Lathyrus sativus]|nr:unnamed protein product [Lathyrus sativus]
MGASTKYSSKRTNTSASGAHSSSFNPETPSSYDYNLSSPMECPMRQQVAKRKGKARENANTFESPSNVEQDTWHKRVATIERLAQCKEEEMEFNAMKFIKSDTSTMNDCQLSIHKKYCNKWKAKYGL